MPDVLLALLLFAAKTVLVVGGILVVLLMIAVLLNRSKGQKPQLEIKKLNDRYRAMRHALQAHLLNKKELKVLTKQEKSEKKQASKDEKRPRAFVLDFNGDIRASAVQSLREEITAVLSVAGTSDEVVLRLESPGGLVHSYGLAASQLQRLKERKIPLTICVDKLAASGGYMMACLADRLLAAPFAVVGSIGVVASLPNFSKVLKKHDVEYREVTAGDYKRTVSVLGEITPQGMEKFKQQIQETHALFKDFVKRSRPVLDVDQVATGEVWYGLQALELKLIDGLQTSDDYLLQKSESAEVLRIRYHGKRKLSERFAERAMDTVWLTLHRYWAEMLTSRFGV